MKNKSVRYISYICLCAVALLCAANGYAQSVKVRVKGFPESAAIAFAKEELTTFMTQAMNHEHIRERFVFELVYDKDLRDGEFACKAVSPHRFILRGGDAASVSHAVYTLLEKLGYTFDISRTIVPDSFHFDSIRGADFRILPKVRWRGIRQHVNFPMDISSYPIDEAKDYLNNLVRLRFNKLVVHSYPGFWHEQPQGDSVLYGGNFFYDSPHYYGSNASIKRHVRFNDSLFCIPSIEKVYFEQPLKSRKAMAWMNELLNYAKNIGLRVQFSIEPRSMSLDRTVSTVKHLLEAYPAIDDMELITEEMGGWGARCTRREVEQTLTKYFGNDILADTIVAATIKDAQVDLNDLYGQLGSNIAAVRQLKQDNTLASKNFKLGIYCTTGYAKAAYHLARTKAPDVPVAIMPSHGSEGVSRAVGKIIRDVDDMRSTEIYSWIEFDGLMYLQQNPANGINSLFEHTGRLMKGGQLPSVCFNHWRTCENRVAARFASEVTLNGAMTVMGFYLDYARRLGISLSAPSAAAFANVMSRMNALDDYATRSLGNIGFCWTGAWRHAGLFVGMNVDNLDRTIEGYVAARRQLADLLADTLTTQARDVLALLENRTEATILYLEAFKVATELRAINRDRMTDAEKQRVVSICNRALAGFEKYIDKYAELLPDRGSEGVLVSVWNAPMYGLKLIRQNWGGVPMEESWHNDNPVDSPPLPIHN